METLQPIIAFRQKLPVWDPPFGLPSSAQDPIAPLIAWLRLLVIQLYTYLDDLLIIGDSALRARFELAWANCSYKRYGTSTDCLLESFSRVAAYKPAHPFLNLLGLMAAI